MKIHVISLGCPKNLVDSERICASLGMAGVELSPQIENSDCILINTCGFIRSALVETEEEIRQVLEETRGQSKKVYVYGCGVTRAREYLEKEFPEVTCWFALGEQDILLKSIHTESKRTTVRLLTTHGYAYLKLAEGCSNNCAYCTIPSIRGPYKSYDMNHLLREARNLAACGIKELILIAQDTGRYGLDTQNEPLLVPLLRRLSAIDGIEWLRIMYMHPRSLSLDMINELATNPKVCKYIDMPIQHINDRILTLMNRNIRRREIEQKVNRLKDIKNISIRTTVMTCFPSETDGEFKELISYVKDAFDWIGVFPFSPEPGTQAYELPSLSQDVIMRRYSQLIDLQQHLVKQKNEARIGSKYRTLIHGHNGHYLGHSAYSCPEIDSCTIIPSKTLAVGEFVTVKIAGITGSDLTAEVIKNE